MNLVNVGGVHFELLPKNKKEIKLYVPHNTLRFKQKF